jgi:hypothetical protein
MIRAASFSSFVDATPDKTNMIATVIISFRTFLSSFCFRRHSLSEDAHGVAIVVES